MKKAAVRTIKRIARSFGIKLSRATPAGYYDQYYGSDPETAIFLNIGAGSFRHERWINVDKSNEFYGRIQNTSKFISHDLCKDDPLPFEDNSAHLVYTSHTIEHLPLHNVNFLLGELYRCLKPGGLLRIVCPDMELQYRAYRRNDSSVWAQPSPWHTHLPTLEERFLEHFATALVGVHASSLTEFNIEPVSADTIQSLFKTHSMNEFFDALVERLPNGLNTKLPQGHCNWFTYQKLHSLLQHAQFCDIRQSAYRQSDDPRMRDPDLFDNTCPELSLFVEAYK